ncbi:hypothetical protein [Faecalibaculum rodentium]|uniref:hypothetical protein n=1 Tax=Faecalibaculum rodentium TaxID=1702221 RepID=UPI0027299E1B|nr:hypothetical protein [Faecalibaculum rodentium]
MYACTLPKNLGSYTGWLKIEIPDPSSDYAPVFRQLRFICQFHDPLYNSGNQKDQNQCQDTCQKPDQKKPLKIVHSITLSVVGKTKKKKKNLASIHFSDHHKGLDARGKGNQMAYLAEKQVAQEKNKYLKYHYKLKDTGFE